jgi:hypothetical protein
MKSSALFFALPFLAAAAPLPVARAPAPVRRAGITIPIAEWVRPGAAVGLQSRPGPKPAGNTLLNAGATAVGLGDTNDLIYAVNVNIGGTDIAVHMGASAPRRAAPAPRSPSLGAAQTRAAPTSGRSRTRAPPARARAPRARPTRPRA